MTAAQQQIDVERAREQAGRNEAIMVDARSPEEFALGHIPGAVNAPDGSLPEDLDEGPVIVVCEDGERSADLAARLCEDGRDASSIEGGMKAWNDEKFPTQPSSDPLEGEGGKAPKLPGAGV